VINTSIIKAGIAQPGIVKLGLVRSTIPPTPPPSSPYTEPFSTANWQTELGYNWQQSIVSDTYVSPWDVTFPMSAYFGVGNNNVFPATIVPANASDSRFEFTSDVIAATQTIFAYHTDNFSSGYLAQVFNFAAADSFLLIADLATGLLSTMTLTGVAKVNGIWLKVIDNGNGTQNLEIRYADAAAPTIWVLATPAITRPSIVSGRPLWAVGIDTSSPAPVAGDIVHANLWRGTNDASLV